MTLAFLGSVSPSRLLERMGSLPLPSWRCGRVAVFDEQRLLPYPRNPNVVAWHVDWCEALPVIPAYQSALASWLREQGYPLDKRKFLPHVTLARKPFNPREWRNIFTQLPVMLTDVVLYESLGGLRYKPLWKHEVPAPFEELDHTADRAFIVRGEDLQQLLLHAQMALAFKAPELLPYRRDRTISSRDDAIAALNDMIADADAEEGCCYKAVSYHGEIHEGPQGLLEWEMMVDV